MRLLSKIKSGIAILLCVSSVATHAYAQIETKAQFAYIYDYDTKTVLLDKNGDTQMGPSSMTKLMTLYVLFSKLKKGDITLETQWPISETAWRKGGSKMYVKEGDTVKVEDLIKGIIVASGNDACIVVAEALAGSEEAFAEEMNYMAEKIGLTKSHFKNATGWPDAKHKMTAKDLVTLSIRLYEDFPEYYKYFDEKEFTYNEIKQSNRNKLVFKDIGVDGLKTGFTNNAGYGIVVSSEQNGRRIFLAINGLTSVKERISEAERLVHRSFSDFKKIVLFKPFEDITSATVWGGIDESVPLASKEEVAIVVNNRLSQREKVELEVHYQHPIIPPHLKGEEIAELIIKVDGEVTKKFPLVTNGDVPLKAFFGSAMAKLGFVLMGYENQKP